MKVVIDYEFLRGNQDDIIVKEHSIAAKNVIHTLHFHSSYRMSPHGSDEMDSIGMMATFLTDS